jgi:6-phosphogluconate dehydrogenase
MELGMIGLGRMGGNMAERLQRAGHRVVGTSRSRQTVDEARARGLECVYSVPELLAALSPPRAVWVMVPAGEPTEAMLAQLAAQLQPGEIIIEGGNSNYHDTQRRATELKDSGLHLVDVGTSGGIWGLQEGYSLMIGGEAEPVERLRPLIEALAPAPDRGWGHVGPSGAGHFVKMIHNGIEYGMMQALAEGFAIMHAKEPLGLDLAQIATLWQHGSVVRSWLLDLTAAALQQDASLAEVAPYVSDSGEGRWTVQEGIDLDVPCPVITLSLIERLASRDSEGYGNRLLAVMRQQFGGHAIKQPEAL